MLVQLKKALESDNLPSFFHMMDYFSTRDISAPVETHTDWERFRSLAADLISPRIQTDIIEGAEKAVNNFAVLPRRLRAGRSRF
jgi:hypothetical protein